jgi:hypothetical protein
MSSFPKNLIGHDMQPYLARRDKRRAQASIFFRRLVGATLITAAFAIVSHMAAADGKRTQIARSAAAAQNNQDHAADCYGAQTYLDASDRPEHLVSPEMAVFITVYGTGGDLTECDME